MGTGLGTRRPAGDGCQRLKKDPPLSNGGALARQRVEANERSLEMCPACIAAAAVTVAKVASAGGLAAYGIGRLLAAAEPPAPVQPPRTPGDCNEGDRNETAERRIPG
jgi:hypothetical protein